MDSPRNCRISLETLLDYLEGRTAEAAGREIATHLESGCARCTPQVAELQRLLPVMREAYEYEAPASVVERAKAIHRERFVKPTRISLIGRLISDSRAGFAMAGARGAERAGVRMVFATDDHDIDLWQEREPGGSWYVIGQAVVRSSGNALTPDAVELLTPSGIVSEATAEADEFHLADVPAGSYDLRLVLGDTDIILPNVTVGA